MQNKKISNLTILVCLVVIAAVFYVTAYSSESFKLLSQ